MRTSDIIFQTIFDIIMDDFEIARGMLKPDVKEAVVYHQKFIIELMTECGSRGP